MENLKISNLTSGRFWLTIITGLVFAYSVYAKILTSEVIATIIVMVFTNYFNKRENGNSPK